jgi:uncharacterized membrane protein (DUF4010 family)
VAGTTDVDAITLSVAKLHGQGLSAHTAVTAITLALLTNTFVKVGIAAWLGGAALGRRFLFAQLAVVSSGLVMLLV